MDTFPSLASSTEEISIQWRNAETFLRGVTDGAGRGIEEGILETVTALVVLGFTTNQSCEGHEEIGSPYPWVEIYTRPPEGNREDPEIQAQWRTQNNRQRIAIEALLEEFYRERSTSPELKLSITNIGIFGGFRIQSAETILTSLQMTRIRAWENLSRILGLEGLISKLKQSTKKGKLISYKAEMNDFTEFLKRKLKISV